VSQRAPDRRRDVRFEVVGALWGTLVTSVCSGCATSAAVACWSNRRASCPSGPVIRSGSPWARLRARPGARLPLRVWRQPKGRAVPVGLDFVHVRRRRRVARRAASRGGAGDRRYRTRRGDRHMSDDNHWKDRRRTPRRIVRRVQALELEICEAVRILDVSSSGAMVAGAAQPDGASAALRTAPGGVPVVLPLEVRWHRPRAPPRRPVGLVASSPGWTAMRDGGSRPCCRVGPRSAPVWNPGARGRYVGR